MTEHENEMARLRYRIRIADECICWLTHGGTKEASRGFALAREYMRQYGDSLDNAAIDAALKPALTK